MGESNLNNERWMICSGDIFRTIKLSSIVSVCVQGFSIVGYTNTEDEIILYTPNEETRINYDKEYSKFVNRLAEKIFLEATKPYMEKPSEWLEDKLVSVSRIANDLIRKDREEEEKCIFQDS